MPAIPGIEFLALGTTPARGSIQSRRKKVGQKRSTCAIGSALKQSLHHPAEG
jgi:hypothetical protein